MLEAICVFGYREYHKILLCILVKLHEHIYGKKSTTPQKLLELFNLNSSKVLCHMDWQGKSTPSDSQHSYSTEINKWEVNVQAPFYRPLQQSLEKIGQMDSFYNIKVLVGMLKTSKKMMVKCGD